MSSIRQVAVLTTPGFACPTATLRLLSQGQAAWKDFQAQLSDLLRTQVYLQAQKGCGRWHSMTTLLGEGWARALGVSNFFPDRLIDLIDHHDVVPVVNQVETHMFFQ